MNGEQIRAEFIEWFDTTNQVRSMEDWSWRVWQAALSAKSVPDGWKLVPIEPTHEMMECGENALGYLDTRWENPNMDDVYKAMLSAAPQPSTDDRVRELEKDAERWRYFVETCSSEMGYAICGHEDASNEQINEAIDQAMSTGEQG